MIRARYTLLFAAGLAGNVLAPVVARAQHMMPAAAPAPATAPEQAVVLVAMTGDATVDPHLRATAEALKQRVLERGYRDVDPAALGQALAAPGGVATLRNRLGAACLVRVDVQEGEEVQAGQVVAILEAMKMENELSAPTGGVVKQIFVSPGASVERGQAIAQIE